MNPLLWTADRQTLEWHHPTYPRKKEFQANPSAEKVMALFLWGTERVILLDSVPHCHTIVLDLHIQTYKTLQVRFREFFRTLYRVSIKSFPVTDIYYKKTTLNTNRHLS